MEGGTMRGDGIVPTPLALSEQCLNGSQLSFGSTLVDDELCLEVGTGKLLLGTGAHLVTLLLALIHILAQHLCILTVTGLAGAVNLGQRRLYLMVRELHAALLLIGHVAVSTRHAALGMYALLRHLPTGMLGLQNLGLRQRMDVVVETNFVVICLSSLASQPLVVREHQVVGFAGILLVVRLDEVVLHMALGTHQRAHLLLRGIFHVQAPTGKSLVEGRTGRTQVHRARIVAVATTDGVHLFGTQLAPLLGIEVSGVHDRFRSAELTHHSWHVRTLTRPARRRLHVSGNGVGRNLNAGIACAQNLAHIL